MAHGAPGFVDPSVDDTQLAVTKTLLTTWLNDIVAIAGALVYLPLNHVATGRPDGEEGTYTLNLPENHLLIGGLGAVTTLPPPPAGTGTWILVASGGRVWWCSPLCLVLRLIPWLDVFR